MLQHDERLLWNIRVPSLVLIAQAVFPLERGQTDKQTDANECPTHAVGYAGVGNYSFMYVLAMINCN